LIEQTILGPPGCGKTQTNSKLVKEFIDKGINPSKIANVSFTKKAATEKKEFVKTMICKKMIYLFFKHYTQWLFIL